METKILGEETILFKVVIPKTNGCKTVAEYITSAPIKGQFHQVFVKEKSDSFEAICMTENHSDFISLEERTGFKVTAI